MFKFKFKIDSEYFDMDYKQFEKSEKFDEYRKNSSFLEMPLMKRLDLTKWKSLTTKGLRDAIGKRWEEVKDVVDPRNITETQRTESEEQVTSAYTMYNEFNVSKELREKLIAEKGVEYFEVNLDTVMLKYAFSSIRENVMNEVLPLLNSAAMVIKHYAYQTGKYNEVKDTIEDFYKQLRISIYGVNPIKGELSEALGVVSKVQKVASIAMITLRPVLMMKELIAGTFKNVSYAWTKVYGDNSFTMKDLSSAYNKVMFSKLQTPMDFTIVDNLNIRYGIANMDINNMVKKSKVDRFGAYKFFSEHLY